VPKRVAVYDTPMHMATASGAEYGPFVNGSEVEEILRDAEVRGSGSWRSNRCLDWVRSNILAIKGRESAG